MALELLTWEEARELGARHVPALIPFASLEQHGPHLPLSTDSLLAERTARDVAELLEGPVIVTPVMRGGLSTHHLAFPGSITIAPAAYQSLATSYLEGLERMGVRRIGLFTTHGGNISFLESLVADYAGEATLATSSDLGPLVRVARATATSRNISVPETDVHAGGLETSMMLAAYPDLVRPYDGVVGLMTAEPGWLDRVASEGVDCVSGSGVLGDVTLASADLGESLLVAIAQDLAQFFAERLDVPLR